jgi:K+-sensing histidine kinase KdpD
MSQTDPKHDPTTAEELQVPMADVARFVRQLSHDLRNHLNAAELQAAYLKEILDDAEAKEEVQRLRAMVSELGGALQKLTASLAPVKLTCMPYEASAFVEDLRHKVDAQFAERAGDFEWQIEPTEALLEIDPQLLQQAMLELFTNALQHGRAAGKISARAATEGGEFVLTLREPKSAFELSTDGWGREPFKLVKHGHYGLGLHRARSIVEAHGGRLAARYDSAGSALATTVSLPIARGV